MSFNFPHENKQYPFYSKRKAGFQSAISMRTHWNASMVYRDSLKYFFHFFMATDPNLASPIQKPTLSEK